MHTIVCILSGMYAIVCVNVCYSIRHVCAILNHKEYIMLSISFRIDKVTEEFLRDLCHENNDKSINVTAKKLLNWCAENKINPSKQASFFDSEVRKMIEHIHMSIPHLMLSSHLTLQSTSSDLPDEKKDILQRKTLKYLNKSVGDFQNVEYKRIKVTYNNFGIKQTPESEEYTEWK